MEAPGGSTRHGKGEKLWGYVATFVSTTGGLTPGEVEVRFGEEFNGRPLPAEHEQAKDALWSARIATNPLLFNGLKFRCAAHEPTLSDDGAARLRFDVGLTDYKTFLATNAAGVSRIAELKAAASEAGLDRHAYLANPIGVDVVCRTSDDLLVFLKRSAHVAEASGMWAAVGGHPEPYMMLHTALESPATAPINAQPTERDVFDGHRRWLGEHASEEDTSSGTLVIRELFEAVLREVEEELGLGADVIVASRLLGTFSAAWVEGKVDVVFVVDTRLTFAQVAAVYAKGHHQDAFEHTALDGLSETEVRAWLDQADDTKAAAHVHAAIGRRNASLSAAKAQRNISPYTRATLDVYLRATSV